MSGAVTKAVAGAPSTRSDRPGGRRSRARLALGAALLALACVHSRELVPAPDAQLVPGQSRTAEDTAADVRVVVDSAAWSSGAVRDALSPVRVTIENRGQHPLRITYNAFTLAGPTGFRLSALPPVQVAAANPVAPVEPAFAYQGFWLAPWYSPFYRHHFAVWSGAFVYDEPYYVLNYRAWPPALPDEEILSKALPEGVLDAGGRVEGFLFFPDQPHGTAVRFLFSLIDAKSGQAFGTVQIPFVVK